MSSGDRLAKKLHLLCLNHKSPVATDVVNSRMLKVNRCPPVCASLAIAGALQGAQHVAFAGGAQPCGAMCVVMSGCDCFVPRHRGAGVR